VIAPEQKSSDALQKRSPMNAASNISLRGGRPRAGSYAPFSPKLKSVRATGSITE
jgi:hypothetical protein